MQNKIRRKRLNNRSVLGCWQLVASIWVGVALGEVVLLKITPS